MSDDFGGGCGAGAIGGGEGACQPVALPSSEITEQVEIPAGQVLISEQLLQMQDDTLMIASGISLRESNSPQAAAIAWSLRRLGKRQSPDDT
jgi:hypothetical protein